MHHGRYIWDTYIYIKKNEVVRRLGTFYITCLIGPTVSKRSPLTVFLGQTIPLGTTMYHPSGRVSEIGPVP